MNLKVKWHLPHKPPMMKERLASNQQKEYCKLSKLIENEYE
jgi:hypothetical protein